MYKVLIIEDENIIREGLKHLVDWVSMDALVVKESVDGREGLSDILEYEPDIVLLDINIPFLNGLEVLESAYKNHIFSTIIISGYDDFEYAKKAIKYGVIDYLLKPINRTELEDAIVRAQERIEKQRNAFLLEQTVTMPNQIEVLDIEKWDKLNNNVKYLDDMIDFIKKNYAMKISMTDVSDRIGVSVTYLNKNFKKGTSFTFNDFLNRYRVEIAIKKIKNNENKISVIAKEVGFKNYRYFISVFKKYTDYLPSDFLTFADKQNILREDIEHD